MYIPGGPSDGKTITGEQTVAPGWQRPCGGGGVQTHSSAQNGPGEAAGQPGVEGDRPGQRARPSWWQALFAVPCCSSRGCSGKESGPLKESFGPQAHHSLHQREEEGRGSGHKAALPRQLHPLRETELPASRTTHTHQAGHDGSQQPRVNSPRETQDSGKEKKAKPN